MGSTLLQVGTKIIFPIQLFVGFFLFLRGHNLPGGGFIAGLVLACSFIIYTLAFGADEAKKKMGIHPIKLFSIGWMVAILGGGILPLFANKPLFTGVWGGASYFPFVGVVKFSSVFLFDLGVFILVLGITMQMVFLLVKNQD